MNRSAGLSLDVSLPIGTVIIKYNYKEWKRKDAIYNWIRKQIEHLRTNLSILLDRWPRISFKLDAFNKSGNVLMYSNKYIDWFFQLLINNPSHQPILAWTSSFSYKRRVVEVMLSIDLSTLFLVLQVF